MPFPLPRDTNDVKIPLLEARIRALQEMLSIQEQALQQSQPPEAALLKSWRETVFKLLVERETEKLLRADERRNLAILRKTIVTFIFAFFFLKQPQEDTASANKVNSRLLEQKVIDLESEISLKTIQVHKF